MKDERKAGEIAVERIKMLGPLLEQDHDKAKAAEKKREICERYGISERTLRRYLSEYRKNGFSGLKPKQTGSKSRLLDAAEKINRDRDKARKGAILVHSIDNLGTVLLCYSFVTKNGANQA
ncbi:MAG: helix-turn-helix domain-containing protein [Natronincolaceae bacterium]|jgi:NADH/NAD ratio-sensing transcriptional regulator Rex|nr:helix-turn-helix domain-containing protein [Bacillota bacterium]